VYLCVDVYWVAHGGADPVAFLQKHLDRIGTVHFKDMALDGSFAEVGQGTLDFPGMMEVLATRPDLGWIIVEQDRTSRSPEESISLSRQYMRGELGL
jgi:sugar phosphate isomerase/epimerase